MCKRRFLDIDILGPNCRLSLGQERSGEQHRKNTDNLWLWAHHSAAISSQIIITRIPTLRYFFTGQMPFLLLNQQCQSTEGMHNISNKFYLLFSGVIKLILVGPTEALLNTAVSPQSFHCGQQLFREWLCVFHSRYHIDYHLRIGLKITNIAWNLPLGTCSYVASFSFCDGNYFLAGFD